MSRTAAATPPPPLFQKNNVTPSQRHVIGKTGGVPANTQPSAFQRHFKSKHSATQSPSSAANSARMGPPPMAKGMMAPAVHSRSPSPTKPVVPMSASDMLGLPPASDRLSPDPMSLSRTGSIWSAESDAVSITPSVPSMVAASASDSDSLNTIATPESTPSSSIHQDELKASSVTPPQPTVTVAPSPRSWVNPFGKMARAVGGGIFNRKRETDSPKLRLGSPSIRAGSSPAPMPSPAIPLGMSPYIAPSPASVSLMTNSPAVIMSPMAFATTPAAEAVEMMSPAVQPLPPHALPPAVALPHNMPPALQPDSPEIDNPVEALRRYEWAEAQRKHVTQCARLCSQWPQSGYNLAKWGPTGCPSNYVPQSWSNPRHVTRTMQRQAELERKLCEDDATFFAAQGPKSADSSDTSDGSGSIPSGFSLVSSQTSLATSTSAANEQDQLCAAVWAATKKAELRSMTSAEESSGPVQLSLKRSDQQTADDLRAAMASPIVDEAWRGSSSFISVRSAAASVATSVATSAAEDKDDSKSDWQSLANSTKSLSELDGMAKLATSDKMDIDEQSEPLSSIPSVPGSHPASLRGPPQRASSCPAKRPLTMVNADDEDKRRRVDEPMAIDTPVFTDEPTMFSVTEISGMSASAPNLAIPPQVTMFGHVVKTSETHPIIISPFVPTEIIPVLGKYLVMTPDQPSKPLLLASELDVPSLLLSCAPPNQCASEAGPAIIPGSAPATPAGNEPECPKTLIFTANRPTDSYRQPTQLGNLVLSSCPGKRLRMEGPVKGRGPVCRDLKTDFKRIKGEGVGAVVCCLDNDELGLLGVPWEKYSELASEIGIDVIRLPMPDGFTPVSLQLFDAQVSLIARQYTLKGINVLVHCRGGIGRAGLTACAWAIKMGFVQPHPSLAAAERAVAHGRSASAHNVPSSGHGKSRKSKSSRVEPPTSTHEEEQAIVMSIVERVIAMIRSRRGLKAIESYEQVHFLATYVAWLRESIATTP